MNKKELKLYVQERLKNRIEMLSKERNISMNKFANYLLEIGLYKLLEEESEFGKLNIRKKRKESDINGDTSYINNT